MISNWTGFHSERDGHFEVVCEHPSLATKKNQNVTVSYKFKTRAEQIGHVIHTTVNYPTYDVTIEFTFGNSSIDYVDVIDYFVSSRSPLIRSTPDEKKPSKKSVELKEWVFPKGGVAFVWEPQRGIQLASSSALNNLNDQII